MVAKSTSIRSILCTLARKLELQRQAIRSTRVSNSSALDSQRHKIDRQLLLGSKMIETELSSASMPSLAVRVPAWTASSEAFESRADGTACESVDNAEPEIDEAKWVLLESETLVEQIYGLVRYSPAREPIGRVLAGLHQINSNSNIGLGGNQLDK